MNHRVCSIALLQPPSTHLARKVSASGVIVLVLSYSVVRAIGGQEDEHKRYIS